MSKGLAMFTMKNVERERKLRFLFDIYDIDGDGLICNSELYKVRKDVGRIYIED